MSIFGRHNDPDGKNGMDPETIFDDCIDDIDLIG